LLLLFTCYLCNIGYVLAKFIATIGLGCLVCTFEIVLVGGATAVLFVDFVVPDKSFKVCLCIVEIVFDGFRLVLPLWHLFLVKVVQGIHLLEIKLELVFVGDCNAKPFDAHLVVVKALAKNCEMLFSVPLRIVGNA
jgi:hypothetical protein